MRRSLILFSVLAIVMAACGSGDAESSDSADILAATALHMATDANTFEAGHRFTEVLVVDRVVPDAGDPMNAEDSGDRLTEDERSAIRSVLEAESRVQFISSPDDFRTDDLRPTIDGAAIFTLAPIQMIDDTTAHVSASMWCGGVCGLWATFVVELVGSEWTVTGTDGPIAVS